MQVHQVSSWIDPMQVAIVAEKVTNALTNLDFEIMLERCIAVVLNDREAVVLAYREQAVRDHNYVTWMFNLETGLYGGHYDFRFEKALTDLSWRIGSR